ncbi:hypothetical protein K1719_002823 [Acacia pycnantha]|nr:hypothetical protein K1719_002823 [Acacia pycnantha]
MGFFSITCPRLVYYTKLISSHINQARHDQALAIFHHIHSSLAMSLDPHVFSLILKSCTAISRPQLGTAIHAYVTKVSFISNPFIASTLIDLYGYSILSTNAQTRIEASINNTSFSTAVNLIKEIHGYAIRNDIDSHPQLSSGLVEAYGRCGCLFNAHSIFWRMKEKDVVAWSNIISAYALHGDAKSALEIFQKMELVKVRPDDITFLVVLKACSHSGLADEASYYFKRMREYYGIEANSDHYSCLIDVLSRAGRLYEAYEVIREMPVKVTAKAWGALLGACRTFGEVELAEIAGRALSRLSRIMPPIMFC